MSGSYRVLFRKGKEEEEDGQIELTTVPLDGGDGEVEVDSASDGELVLGAKEDRKSLIQEEEIDENGVVRDYEVALKHVGFGLFHVLLIAVNGVALTSDAVEVLAISFILPILREPEEFGVTDSQNALLSSVIFMGMLFGSYCWGGFADVVGRRMVLLLSLTLNGLFGLMSAFSPNFSMFIICRFISGLGVGGSLPVIFPYIAEFTRNKYRGPYLGVQSFFWTFGRFLCGGLAWIILPQAVVNFSIGSLTIHSWRVYIAVTALPSLIGALLYFLLPESPRFLLETGKEQKALKALRMAYCLNHLQRRGKKEFPVKRIQLDLGENGGKSELKGSGCGQRLRVFTRQVRQVLSQTAELFHRHLLRRTSLLLIILFCLSFGSYGVTLWYPSYVQLVTEEQEHSHFNTFCHRNTSSPDLPDYCGCEGASFSGHDFSQLSLHNFKLSGAEFSHTVFSEVTMTQVSLEDCSFSSCQFENVTFKSGSFRNVVWNGVTFNDVTFSNITFCNGSVSGVVGGTGVHVDGEGVSGDGERVRVLVGMNTSCDGVEVECEEETSDRVYRDNFFIAGAALPGNIVSAIAVYFLRRNYWMAMSLFASTASVFVLYVVHSEVFVVVMLCVFTALSTPAWNDSSLLITELYPTHLRSTAMGIHLLSARVGAILGTNLFGLFIHVNPSIPILLVACVLLVGSCAALPLPKTTRKTHLQ